jgi:hypothetical protein
LKGLTRLLLAGSVTLTALAASTAAMAAFTTPKLTILNPTERPGVRGPLTIRYEQDRNDDAPFRIVVYVPQGYASSLVQPTGTTLGTVTAQIQAKQISNDAVVPVTGTIAAADPATYTSNPQSLACVGAGNRIDAVYVLVLAAAGQELRVPMYVTAITGGPEAAFASAKFTFCLPSPDLPVAQGGATLGAKLIQANLRLTSLFTTPPAAGAFTFRALATPYATLSGTPDPAGTVEVQSVDAVGNQLVLASAVLNPRTRRLTLRGRLTEAGAPAAGTVRIAQGRTRTGLKRVVSVRASASGTFAAVVRVPRRGNYFFRADAVVATREVAGCAQSFAPVPCLRQTRGGFMAVSSVFRVRIR